MGVGTKNRDGERGGGVTGGVSVGEIANREARNEFCSPVSSNLIEMLDFDPFIQLCKFANKEVSSPKFLHLKR